MRRRRTLTPPTKLSDHRLHAGCHGWGVNSAGAPWKVRKGHATLEATGRLRVEVEGLLLLNNTTGRVVEVVASLVCGGSGGSVSPMATGTPVGLSAAGNAEMRDDLTLTAPARRRWCWSDSTQDATDAGIGRRIHRTERRVRITFSHSRARSAHLHSG